MRTTRRVLGWTFLLVPLLLAVGVIVFGPRWRDLETEAGWEWVWESPARLPLGVLAVLAIGIGLLVPDARRSPVRAVLAGVFAVAPPLLVFGMFALAARFGPLPEHRVVRFPDPGPFAAEVVALTSGPGVLNGDLYVRRGPGERFEYWFELDYDVRCTWPFEVHRSPGRPRYLFADADGHAVTVLDLGEDPPGQFLPGDLSIDALREEFGASVTLRPDPGPIRVMTFNVRYDNPGDGDDRWQVRRDFVIEVIRKAGPDLLGLQEVLDDQGRFLREGLPGYGFVGVGRDDGERKGEFAPVMFRKERFEKIDSGTFWLSETPDVVGSRGWDAVLPRIATWVRLRDRELGRPLLFLNTHWDHRGERARMESAQLVRRFLDARNEAVVVTGDFNSPVWSEPYRHLRETLLDPYRMTRLRPKTREGTYHAFRGVENGDRIDWVLCSGDFAPRSGAVVRTSREGRYPSDHYPVTATVFWILEE